MQDSFNTRVEIVRAIWRHPHPLGETGLKLWTCFGVYDLLISQFFPVSWGEYAPRVRDLLYVTGGWLPYWGWLLVLAAILIAISLEFAFRRRNNEIAGQASAQSFSPLTPAWIFVLIVTLCAPVLGKVLGLHSSTQSVSRLGIETSPPITTQNVEPPRSEPQIAKPDYVVPLRSDTDLVTKPTCVACTNNRDENRLSSMHTSNPRSDTSESNKEFTDKTAAYFMNIRRSNTSIRTKNLLKPYDNALFRFSGKVKNISSLSDSVAVNITLKDKNTVYCLYPLSSLLYLSRFDVGDDISGVGTINDELDLPAVVLYGCHPKLT